jgi:hypothetical protein
MTAMTGIIFLFEYFHRGRRGENFICSFLKSFTSRTRHRGGKFSELCCVRLDPFLQAFLQRGVLTSLLIAQRKESIEKRCRRSLKPATIGSCRPKKIPSPSKLLGELGHVTRGSTLRHDETRLHLDSPIEQALYGLNTYLLSQRK